MKDNISFSTTTKTLEKILKLACSSTLMNIFLNRSIVVSIPLWHLISLLTVNSIFPPASIQAAARAATPASTLGASTPLRTIIPASSQQGAAVVPEETAVRSSLSSASCRTPSGCWWPTLTTRSWWPISCLSGTTLGKLCPTTQTYFILMLWPKYDLFFLAYFALLLLFLNNLLH